MDDKTYNGWTNYETWATALWLDNDATSSAFWSAEAWECWKAAPTSSHVQKLGFDRERAAALDLAERLNEAIHEQCPDLGACLYADLLGAALAEVQWFEIASHHIDDLQDETEEVRKGESNHE